MAEEERTMTKEEKTSATFWEMASVRYGLKMI